LLAALFEDIGTTTTTTTKNIETKQELEALVLIISNFLSQQIKKQNYYINEKFYIYIYV
jgi:hypothetical protein